MFMQTPSEELIAFKTTDIVRFLPGLGWQNDGKNPKGKHVWNDGRDNIAIYISKSGQWMWKDHANGKSGTVIDLALRIAGATDFSAARRLLRTIAGSAPPVTIPSYSYSPANSALPTSNLNESSTPEPGEKKTPAEVEAEYLAGSSAWLIQNPIPDLLLARGLHCIRPQHAGTFRVSRSTGRIRFPYYSVSANGSEMTMVGMESKGNKSKGQKDSFMTGGSNGIWVRPSKDRDLSGTAIICENPIDCLSYDLIHGGDGGDLLIALRSGSEADAVRFLKNLIETDVIRKIVIATDNDSAGMLYASKIFIGLKEFKSLKIFYSAPLGLVNDQNDALRAGIAAVPGTISKLEKMMRAYRDAEKATTAGEGDHLPDGCIPFD